MPSEQLSTPVKGYPTNARPQGVRGLELVLSGESWLEINLTEGARTILSKDLSPDNCDPSAAQALQAIAGEIIARPEVFTDRIFLVSLHLVARDTDNEQQRQRIRERMSKRMLSEMRKSATPQDLVLQITPECMMIISSERGPESLKRWEAPCRKVAANMLGEARADSVQLFGLQGADNDRLHFVTGATVEIPESALPSNAAGRLGRISRSNCESNSPSPAFVVYEGPAEPPMATFGTVPLELSDFDVQFSATWDVKNEVLSVFSAEPYRMIGGRKCTGFPAIEEAASFDKLMFDLCLKLLDHGVAQIERFVTAGQAGMVAVPVNFAALATSWRLKRYLGAVKAVDGGQRQRLCLVVSDIPPGVNGTKLQNMVDMLRPECRAIFLRIGHQVPLTKLVIPKRVHAVGFDFQGDRRPEEDIVRAFEQFARLCRSNKYNSYLMGLNTTSLVLSAAATGIRFISGNRIQAPEAEPAGARHYGWLNFYARSAALGCQP